MDTRVGALTVFEDPSSLVEGVVDTIVRAANFAVKDRGVFYMSLSGGSTPAALYSRLSIPQYAALIDWKNVHLFLGDERCVPHEDKESNYGMIRKTLKVGEIVPEHCLKPTQGQEKDAKAAAENYEQLMIETFGVGEGEHPIFDIMLLGMGPDGHTASLFPDTAALCDSDRLFVENFVPKFDQYRLTSTYPLINAARQIIILVSGSAKAEILAEVFQSKVGTYPVQGVHPLFGHLHWFVDKEAARDLSEVSVHE